MATPVEAAAAAIEPIDTTWNKHTHFIRRSCCHWADRQARIWHCRIR
jgi:hypothetical protein